MIAGNNQANNKQDSVLNSANTIFKPNDINTAQKDHTTKVSCRICLTEQLVCNLQQDYVQPCNCRGSLQYVHKNCLKQWLNRMLEKRRLLRQQGEGVYCQICQQIIDIEYKEKIACKAKTEIKQSVIENKIVFCIAIVFLLLILGVICWVLYFQISFTPLSQAEKDTSKIVFAIAWLFLGTCLFFVVYKITAKFIVKKQRLVDKILSKHKSAAKLGEKAEGNKIKKSLIAQNQSAQNLVREFNINL